MKLYINGISTNWRGTRELENIALYMIRYMKNYYFAIIMYSIELRACVCDRDADEDWSKLYV